jgi:hypothetical protein
MISAEQREKIRLYLESLTGVQIRDAVIKSIDVNPAYHSLPRMRITAGEVCANLEPDAPPEMVVAIFEAPSYLICTPTRGAGEGLPYFFTREEVQHVEIMK